MIESEVAVYSAGEEDLADIASLQALCFSNPWETPRLREAMRQDRSILRVLSLNGVRVGHYLASQVLDEVELLSIAVSPAARKQGVGGALVEDLLEQARKRAGLHIFLEVRGSNEGAIALYRKHGFSAAGSRRSYYSDGEDAILMRYRFEAESGEGSL